MTEAKITDAGIEITAKIAKIDEDGTLDLDALFAAMTPDVKLLGVAHACRSSTVRSSSSDSRPRIKPRCSRQTEGRRVACSPSSVASSERSGKGIGARGKVAIGHGKRGGIRQEMLQADPIWRVGGPRVGDGSANVEPVGDLPAEILIQRIVGRSLGEHAAALQFAALQLAFRRGSRQWRLFAGSRPGEAVVHLVDVLDRLIGDFLDFVFGAAFIVSRLGAPVSFIA